MYVCAAVLGVCWKLNGCFVGGWMHSLGRWLVGWLVLVVAQPALACPFSRHVVTRLSLACRMVRWPARFCARYLCFVGLYWKLLFMSSANWNHSFFLLIASFLLWILLYLFVLSFRGRTIFDTVMAG